MNDYIVGHIRTFVPIAVGALLTWLSTKYGILLSEDTAASTTAALTGIVIAVYYGAVRAAAQRYPQVGILLGVNKAPKYSEE